MKTHLKIAKISILMFLSFSVGIYGQGTPITMAGFGNRVVYSTSNGDTWDSAWCANGTLIFQNNDGYGFSNAYGFLNGTDHDAISSLSGSPESPLSLVGSNVTPGPSSSFMATSAPCYSSGIYEVDGVLYHNVLYSDQIPGAWVFHHNSTMKSVDGGLNWVNHLGQTNTWPPNNVATCSFPKEECGMVNFVKYGQGGVAPNVDNAQTYVYFIAVAAEPSFTNGGYMLGRVSRANLPLLNSANNQYYTGGDGMNDANWVSDINLSGTIPVPYGVSYNPYGWAFDSVVYNPGLQRYLMTSVSSDSWATPQVLSTLRLMEAPHPWGPWSPLLDENVNSKESDNLTWAYLQQKFISSNGTKMWMSASGRSPYGLQFVPIYLTTSPVWTGLAQTATLSGSAHMASSVSGYTGTGYVTGFNAVGDRANFTYNAASNGTYLIKFRYNTTAPQNLGFFINGTKWSELNLGQSVQNYATWSEYSVQAWMLAGSNTISFGFDAGSTSTGGCNLDSVAIAFYSS